MLRAIKKKLAGATIVGLLGVVSASAVNAGSVPAFIPLGDSGWSYFSSDPNISLVTFNSGINEAGLFVSFEKNATWFEDTFDSFTQSYKSKDITFAQTSPDAAPMNLVINRESIVNSTAQSWSGFKMILSDSSGEPTTLFDPANSVNFDTFPPFASKFFSDDNQTFTATDGVLPSILNGGVPWKPAKNLVIYAAANRSGELKTFELKELPIVAIPLPAAAWSGLSGLLGLGVIGAIRKVRDSIA